MIFPRSARRGDTLNCPASMLALSRRLSTKVCKLTIPRWREDNNSWSSSPERSWAVSWRSSMDAKRADRGVLNSWAILEIKIPNNLCIAYSSLISRKTSATWSSPISTGVNSAPVTARVAFFPSAKTTSIFWRCPGLGITWLKVKLDSGSRKTKSQSRFRISLLSQPVIFSAPGLKKVTIFAESRVMIPSTIEANRCSTHFFSRRK